MALFHGLVLHTGLTSLHLYTLDRIVQEKLKTEFETEVTATRKWFIRFCMSLSFSVVLQRTVLEPYRYLFAIFKTLHS